jgi:hypothetical protein
VTRLSVHLCNEKARRSKQIPVDKRKEQEKNTANSELATKEQGRKMLSAKYATGLL